MSLTLTTLKNTELESVVKITGSGDNVTINLRTDLAKSTQKYGIVATVDTLVGGTGYSTTTGTATTGGTGTGLTVNVTQSGGIVSAVAINNPGTGYTVADVITISGGGGNSTFHVATLVDGLPTVNINKIQYLGAASSVITIVRNSVTLYTINSATPGPDFVPVVPDSQQNTSNIVVTFTNAASLILTLRKTSGYLSTIETAQFSGYDNLSLVGS